MNKFVVSKSIVKFSKNLELFFVCITRLFVFFYEWELVNTDKFILFKKLYIFLEIFLLI